jgi:hypothetical protein
LTFDQKSNSLYQTAYIKQLISNRDQQVQGESESDEWSASVAPTLQ